MGTTPVLEYYWVKVLEDGITTIPQFDIESGKQNYWKTDTAPLSKVLYMPFTLELSEKAMVANVGVRALATTNPTIEFIVNPGEYVEAGIDGKVTVSDYFKCDICGWKFVYTKKDGSKFAKCPQCGAEDDWYCSRCKEYKHDYRITKKNQVQCLDCDIPIGLDRTKKLIRMQDVKHTCDYFIRTPTRKVTITNEGKIIV